MKREVVQDFLNLPGIAGVALMDGRSRPYFCGVDQTLNFQQKEALAQGIRQVVDTTPAGFESFEFQFTGHQVYIYKLDQGIILLVLTRDGLVYRDYLQAIAKLKTALQEDVSTAIATFRLLAGNISLTGQNYWKQRSDSPSDSALSPSVINASSTNGTKPPSLELATPEPAENTSDTIVLKEFLLALNHLSQFTTQYLGTAVIVNYWKASQPAATWASNFQIDRTGQISFVGPDAQHLSQPTSPEEFQWLREWVKAFIERCSRVIRDFPALIEHTGLTDSERQLLLGH